MMVIIMLIDQWAFTGTQRLNTGLNTQGSKYSHLWTVNGAMRLYGSEGGAYERRSRTREKRQVFTR